MSRDNRPKKKTPHCGSIPQCGSQHSRSTAADIYEVRPRKDHRSVDLISNSPKHGEEPSPQHPLSPIIGRAPPESAVKTSSIRSSRCSTNAICSMFIMNPSSLMNRFFILRPLLMQVHYANTVRSRTGRAVTPRLRRGWQRDRYART